MANTQYLRDFFYFDLVYLCLERDLGRVFEPHCFGFRLFLIRLRRLEQVLPAEANTANIRYEAIRISNLLKLTQSSYAYFALSELFGRIW